MKFLVGYTAREKKCSWIFQTMLGIQRGWTCQQPSPENIRKIWKLLKQNIYNYRLYAPEHQQSWMEKQTSNIRKYAPTTSHFAKKKICKHWRSTRIFLIKQVHPPKTNQQIAPAFWPKRKRSYSNIFQLSIFRCENVTVVSGRVRFLNSFPCCLYGFRAGIS